MRLLVTSDWHADWQTLGVRRYSEVEAAVEETVAKAIAERVDAYLFLGDLSDPDSGGDVFRAVALAARAAFALAAAGVPSVWIAGNHDVCEDGTGATTLTPLRALEARLRGLVFVAEEPRAVALDRLFLACLPFAPASHGYDPAEAAAAMSAAFAVDPGRRTLAFAAHLSVPGIQPGEETSEMPRGREVVFPFAETRAAALRFNGHYHRCQSFDPGDGGAEVLVPGSLARLTFAEEEHAPSFLLVEV